MQHAHIQRCLVNAMKTVSNYPWAVANLIYGLFSVKAAETDEVHKFLFWLGFSDFLFLFFFRILLLYYNSTILIFGNSLKQSKLSYFRSPLTHIIPCCNHALLKVSWNTATSLQTHHVYSTLKRHRTSNKTSNKISMNLNTVCICG